VNQVHQYQNDGFLVLGGDFNARCGVLEDFIEGADDVPPREVIDYSENSHGDSLIDFCITASMGMLNGRGNGNDYTCISHKGKSVVDYMLVPYEQLYMFNNFQVSTVTDLVNKYDIPVLDNMLSKLDHSLLSCQFDLAPWINNIPMQEATQQEPLVKGVTKFKVDQVPADFLQNKWDQEVQDCIVRIETSLHANHSVTGAYTELSSFVTGKAIDAVPHYKIRPVINKKRNSVKRKNVEYWNDNLEAHWKQVCEVESIWKNCKDRKRVQYYKGNFNYARKQFDRLLKKVRRQHQFNKQEELLNACDTNPNSFWRVIDKIGIAGERKQQIPMEVNENDSIVSDKKKVLDKWKCTFQDIYKNVGDGIFDENHLENISQAVLNMETEYNDLLNREGITEEHVGWDTAFLNRAISFGEVKQAVDRAKKRKAIGIDEIPAELLQNNSCVEMLYKIFSHCFANAVIPSQWEKGIIHPIFKSGSTDARDPLQYRGITLMCSSYKIYCDILNKRLSIWLENRNSIVDEQNGFHPLRNCIDHIYVLYSVLQNRMLRKEDTYCCFIDIKKAFDSVNRTCLYYKLLNMGVKGNMLHAIKSLYQNPKCAVRINNMYTDYFDIPNGLKQGCLLSPTLFKIYVNDLAVEINKLNAGIKFMNESVSLLMFADDIVLLAPSPDELQRLLDKVNDWCRKWRLSLNDTKTQIVHYRHHSKDRSSYNFKCGEKLLKYVDKYKYLGVWLQEHLDMKITVKASAKAATRALGKVIAKFKNNGGSTHKCFVKLFNAAVLPVVTYSAGIWGLEEYGVMNTVLNKAGRFLLGLPPAAPNTATQGEMGWNSILFNTRTEVWFVFLQGLRVWTEVD
jgi:hypothetical protein